MNNKKIIAVVDDSPTFLKKANDILSELYQVHTVPSAGDLFLLLKKVRPDLILLDVIMPETDGNETAKILKKHDEYKDIPLIFLTGVTDIHNEVIGFANGAIDYIHKPFNSAVLLRRIQTHLSIFDNNMELQKEKAEALQTAHTKSEVLSFMSHEIRSPLTAVIGMLGFAESTDDPVKIHDYIHKAYNTSKMLLELINDILDISKIDANMLELSHVEMDFSRMINNIISVIHVHTEAKGQKLIINIDKNVPPFIISDELRLSQVMINLLSNAVKFTPDGGTIILSACLTNDSNNKVTLEFSIEDDGIGISPEHQELIFKSYRQANTDIARKFGGTGLGLMISKRIVELMDGHIWVESKTGEGSKFSFTCKTERGTGKNLNENDQTVPNFNFRQHFDNCKALFIEDNDINREIFIKLLEPTNIDIHCINNGEDALQHYKNNLYNYDIIFTDIHMPGMDGFTLAKEIKNASIKQKTPIIAITADVLEDEEQKYTEAGIDAKITKPYDYDEIVKILNIYL